MSQLIQARNRWAADIYRVLRARDVEITISQWRNDIKRIVRGPRTMTFAIRLPNSADLDKVLKLEDTLALEMGVNKVRIHRTKGLVNIEVTLEKKHHQNIYLSHLPNQRGLWFYPGKTVLGAPVKMKLGGAMFSHALIGGTTGCGKTTLLHSLLIQLSLNNSHHDLNLVVVDGKGGANYAHFKHLPHLRYLALTPQEGAQTLAWALKEIEERQKNPDIKRPTTFVVIDELKEVLKLTGGAKGEGAQALEKITAWGRESRVFCVAATQYVRSDTVGGRVAEANFMMRIAGVVADSVASNLIMGESGAGANQLYGMGDFIITGGHRFQAALPIEQDYDRLPTNGHEAVSPPDLDLGRALNIAEDKSLDVTPAMVAWGINDYLERRHHPSHPISSISARAIRESFDIGMNRARRARDFAQEVYDNLEDIC